MTTQVKEMTRRRNGRSTFVGTITLPKPLYVAIDVAKYNHKAMIFDLGKNILEPPFAFNITQEGFNKLIDKIRLHKEKSHADSIVVGLEATGHYHEVLVENLRAKGIKVILINPYATFKTRSLSIDYVKTDEIDLKAISEAMLLGKGREVIKEDDVYRELKLLTRFRRAKCHARTALKNQMLRDLDCIWAGLNRDCKSSDGLFTNLWESKIARGLMKSGLSPVQMAQMSPQEVIRLIKAQNVKGIGPDWARKIIKHAAGVLPCDETIANIHLQVMKTNLKLLEDLDDLINDLDRKTSILLYKTPGIYLISIQGISMIRVAEFIGEIGNPYKYKEPGELVKLSGLNASRYQSGKTDRKKNPITKMGNSFLRATLFTIARDISRWEPLFIKLKDKFCAKGKHIQVAYGAVANKFLRVSFSLMLRKAEFDRDYEKNKEKEKKCLTQNN